MFGRPSRWAPERGVECEFECHPLFQDEHGVDEVHEADIAEVDAETLGLGIGQTGDVDDVLLGDVESRPFLLGELVRRRPLAESSLVVLGHRIERRSVTEEHPDPVPTQAEQRLAGRRPCSGVGVIECNEHVGPGESRGEIHVSIVGRDGGRVHQRASRATLADVSQSVPFERFMEDALYGPSGFYITSGSAGRRGDFLTSPEVGPLFGALIARHLDAEWRRLGAPDEFTVIDAGAGPGTLARCVLAAAPACSEAMRYVAVEISGTQRSHHPDGVESTDAMPEGPFDGVVIANELLDNLPFRLAVFDQGWREAFVDVAADGTCAERLSAAFDPVPAVLPSTGSFGARAPLVDRATMWVDAARARLRSGSVLVIDYGVARTVELAMRPWREWLRTYRGNVRGDHYLRAVGSQDITTDVPFDQLPEPDSLRTQAQFLQLHGIDELVDEGRRVWREQAARPGLEAMKMRSRVSEAEALLDPDGLGGFLVAEWRA